MFVRSNVFDNYLKYNFIWTQPQFFNFGLMPKLWSNVSTHVHFVPSLYIISRTKCSFAS